MKLPIGRCPYCGVLVFGAFNEDDVVADLVHPEPRCWLFRLVAGADDPSAVERFYQKVIGGVAACGVA